MPVERVPISRPRADGVAWENIKPVYWCEECQGRASFGFVIRAKGKRQRSWYCAAHRHIGLTAWKNQHE